jgi:hypothetical protein
MRAATSWFSRANARLESAGRLPAPAYPRLRSCASRAARRLRRAARRGRAISKMLRSPASRHLESETDEGRSPSNPRSGRQCSAGWNRRKGTVGITGRTQVRRAEAVERFTQSNGNQLGKQVRRHGERHAVPRVEAMDIQVPPPLHVRRAHMHAPRSGERALGERPTNRFFDGGNNRRIVHAHDIDDDSVLHPIVFVQDSRRVASQVPIALSLRNRNTCV